VKHLRNSVEIIARWGRHERNTRVGRRPLEDFLEPLMAL
jgi:hypothetical protein